MITYLRYCALLLAITLFTGKAYAQFPYEETFKNSTAQGITFGGAPAAFLTAAAGIHPEGQGFLRLTNNSQSQKGYIISDASFPSAFGLKVKYEYFVYGGSGADGISFFLFDASVPTSAFQIGGFGGSLGYAQINTTTPASPGVSKGYIGVGLDEFGNFSNPTEGRQLGTGFHPGSITIRGKGDGAAFVPTNYSFIKTVRAFEDFGFRLSDGVAPATEESDPNYRRVEIDLAPNGPGYKVSVRIVVGGTPTVTYPVITDEPYNEPPPAMLRYGLASSTGNQTNFHEIRSVSLKVFNDGILASPTASNDTYAPCLSTPFTFNPLSNDNGSVNQNGSINTNTIDLNPSLAGTQTTYTVPGKGTFTVADASGNVTFTPLNSSVTGPVQATYTFRDTYNAVSTTATITLNDAPAGPSNNNGAGPDQIVNSQTTGASATLNASPLPLNTTGVWTFVSKPAGAPDPVIANPTSPNTTVSNLSFGNYVFRWSLFSPGTCGTPDDMNLQVNAIPTAVNDTYPAALNTDLIMDVTSNDTDPDGTINKTTVVVTVQPTNGTIVLVDGVNGKVTYRPNIGFTGTDNFQYTVKDNSGATSNSAQVNITVSTRPTGADDSYTTTTNQPLPINVKTNDPSSVGTTAVKLTNPVNGAISTLTAFGTTTYTPNTNFHGLDFFTYALENASGLQSTPINVQIVVRPTGVNDLGTTSTNVPLLIPVLDNDPGRVGSTIVLSGTASHGSLVVNSNSVSYTPATDYNGPDQFKYFLRDANGYESDLITVDVQVRPVGSNDTYTTNLNTATSLAVKLNDISKDNTTLVIKTNPGVAGATAVVNGDQIVYTPASGYQGTDVFTYALKGASGGLESAPITVTMTILPRLITTPDTRLTNLNVPVDVDVKVNDASAAGANAIVTVVPLHGTAAVNPDGTLRYTPSLNYYGPDTFKYILRDGGGLESDPTTVTIGVNPAGTNDTYTVALNSTNQLTVKDNDVSKVGTTLIKQAEALHGTVTANNTDGTMVYTPENNYSGTDLFKYALRTSDNLQSEDITVNINIRPLGTADAGETFMNTAVSVPVKNNDVSKTGTNPIVVTPPVNGQVVVNPDGTLTYTPNTGFHGKDPFTYALKTTVGGVESLPISVDVSVRPSAAGDVKSTSVGLPVVANIKDNDPAKTGTTVVVETLPVHGIISLNPDQTITYTPNAAFTGQDFITYTLLNSEGLKSNPVILTINVKPSGTNDAVTTPMNTAVPILVKDNDASKAVTTVIKKSEPAHGTASAPAADGTVTYTPVADFHGKDSFTYSLQTVDLVESDVITVNVTVKPTGLPDNAATTVGTPANVKVKLNDPGKTNTTIVKKSEPTHGTVTVNPDGTSVDYTPSPGYTGPDVFTYILVDPDGVESDPITVTVSVRPGGSNDAYTVAVNSITNLPVKDNDINKTGTTLLKGADPLHGTITLNDDGTIRYAPFTNYAGLDNFTYILKNIADNLLSDAITVAITVRPLGTNDVASTPMNTAVPIMVKDNDASKTGTIVILQNLPAHGTVDVNAAGVASYTPATDFHGKDSFTYLLKTADLVESLPITVDVSVKPVAVADVKTTAGGVPAVIAVKDNDPGKTGSTPVKETNPAHGTVDYNPATQVFTYTPDPTYTGSDSFTYSLIDADLVKSDPVSVIIGVKPSGTNDAAETPMNVAVAVLVKDNDASKAVTSVILGTLPGHGIAKLNSDGTVTYTPDTDFHGKDTFTYTLRTVDGIESDPITAVVSVRPTGVTDNSSGAIGVPVTINVKANDPGKNNTAVIPKTPPVHGSIVVNPDGTITYTPTPGYVGPDTFTYALVDGDNVESLPVTVNIGLIPAGTNDAYTVPLNGSSILAVKDNDVSKTGTTVIRQTDPSHGVITVLADGTVTYTPTLNYAGTDEFRYILKNNDNLLQSEPIIVSITVKPVGSADLAATPMGTAVTIPIKDNDASKALTTGLKKTDPLHGTAVLNADGSVASYTPASGYYGKDTFTYSIRTLDGIESDPITVTVNVKPTGTADAAITASGTPAVVKIKDNDPGKNGTSIVKKTDPLHGTVTVNPDGTVSYTPAASYVGPDTFTYSLLTPDGVESDPIPVTLEVRNLPVATPDVITTVTGPPVKINVIGNDRGDGPIDPKTVVITTPPQHGTISVDPVTGEITYTPFPNYGGPDSFTYTVKDDKGLESRPGTVNINIASPKIGVAKKLLEVKAGLNGTYDIRYLFTIVNYSPFVLRNVSLKDDLAAIFTGTEVKVTRVSHQGSLVVNTGFNGLSSTDLLVPASSTISAMGEEQVELFINVKLVSRAGVFQNTSYVEATNDAGTRVTDQSTDGLRPDPVIAGDVSPSATTPVDLKINPLFIPGGFSPNNDGINDKFVIQNALDKKISVEFYNRWNNLVYKSKDYKNDWEGQVTQGIHLGDTVPAGTYYYIIIVGTDKYVGFITINR
ncbi:Ig-like domain-containing protein [Hufsiella ginkgonis]|uniref:Tandem-95 repeat protein n=1 Tax=Hufsiella ginkgonis TaxID=2695274 RepID=A0A7K1XYU7_9SPHI|nr:Ig-like domain-containing protein [Hufsiella ginkgonis]MXV16165.1 tandem-95 repeat protein [Hufsiella ginkgonis]